MAPSNRQHPTANGLSRLLSSRVRSRTLRIFCSVLIQLVGLGTAGAGAYLANVELPDVPVPPAASSLLYSDGRTVLGHVGVLNRDDVALSEVPEHVRRAVLVAEDKDFYGHRGISVRGMARALWSNTQGNDLQGASTITQQYVKNAFLTKERTVHRKVREVAMALRLEERHSKDVILERYLNSIYFGRGAYGIGAASRAYFGVPIGEISLAQGAVLAAVIKDPWGFDPLENPGPARSRWRWILSAMVDEGWASRQAANMASYPERAAAASDQEKLRGPSGLIVDMVERELARHGIAPQMLRTAGLRVVTTIDPLAQRAAVEELGGALDGQPADLRSALVAVDPLSGAVRAYYGGTQGQGSFDYARGMRPPAATFQPVILAEALTQGFPLRSRWDGSSPRTFAGRGGVPLFNPGNAQCRNCTLIQALTHSLNTPFYEIVERVGPGRVAQLAHRLGVAPDYHRAPTLVDLAGEPLPGRTRPDIALGRYPISPSDLSSVYASFAAEGVRRERHFVSTVALSDGGALPIAPPAEHRALSDRVTADVTTALAAGPVPNLSGARPSVAKSGTVFSDDGAATQDAWTAGYTPDMSVVVWIGRETPGPIREATGHDIQGSTMPWDIWCRFVSRTLSHPPPTVGSIRVPGP